MKLYGVIDLHSNNCVINIIEEHGTVIFKKNIELMTSTLKPYYERPKTTHTLRALLQSSDHNLCTYLMYIKSLVPHSFERNLST